MTGIIYLMKGLAPLIKCCAFVEERAGSKYVSIGFTLMAALTSLTVGRSSSFGSTDLRIFVF